MTTVQAMMMGAILAWAPTILVFIYIVRDMRNTRSLDCHRAQRPRVLHARRPPHQGSARPHGVSEARGGGEGASWDARGALRARLRKMENLPPVLRIW